MEKVVGLGGVFFRAQDPSALGEWYKTNLGLDLQSFGAVVFEASEGDQTVWTPMAADTDYMGRPEQRLMINYRVRDPTPC